MSDTAQGRMCLRVMTDGRCAFPNCSCPKYDRPDEPSIDADKIADDIVTEWRVAGRLPAMSFDFRGIVAAGIRRAVVKSDLAVENDLEHYRRIVRRQDHGEAYDTLRRVNLHLSAQIAKLEAHQSANRDTVRLDWLISGGRYLAHSSDGEFCWVIELDDEGEVKLPLNPHKHTGREAIDAAMGGS